MDTVGIRSADLTNINLDGANFENASLTRCDLTGASLRGTIFRTGQLSYSKLHDADLEGADRPVCQSRHGQVRFLRSHKVDFAEAIGTPL
jgi:uncharacterized protein YjbI with pentapeptide repeats